MHTTNNNMQNQAINLDYFQKSLIIATISTATFLIAFSLPLPWGLSPVFGLAIFLYFQSRDPATWYLRTASVVFGTLVASSSQVLPLRVFFRIGEGTVGDVVFAGGIATLPYICLTVFTLLVVLEPIPKPL